MRASSRTTAVSGARNTNLCATCSHTAVTHYTILELADRFKLMNLAFDQEDYRVDKNLEVISV